ncbi:hypothetical protein [Desulfosporosinus sp. Sb-LF]|uniref:hypothetical protein n=1 Tax=Desulfosporosinus sp. Sb-LF TaxID=2560027 RepID=UPI0018EE8D00|nr:hypothetical protein [Desulfosporosinus sp. Sb-LF]
MELRSVAYNPNFAPGMGGMMPEMEGMHGAPGMYQHPDMDPCCPAPCPPCEEPVMQHHCPMPAPVPPPANQVYVVKKGSTLASTTVNPLISLVFLPISKVYQIRSFLCFVSPLFLIKLKGREDEMRKNYFAKLVNYMKNVYHVDRFLNKLSDGRVNPTYSTGQVILPVLLVFCLGCKALMN